MTTEEKLRIIHTWTYTFNSGKDKHHSNKWYAWIKFSSTQRYSIHTRKLYTYEELIDHAFDTVYRFWWDRINGFTQYVV